MNPFFWALLTALIWGFVPIMEKIGLGKVMPLVGLFYRSLGVILGIILLWAFQSREIRSSFSSLHPGLLYLFFGGLLASVLGQVCFYIALKNGEASRVVPIAAAYPLITFVLGLIFLGEKVTLGKITGILFVLLGVFFLK